LLMQRYSLLIYKSNNMRILKNIFIIGVIITMLFVILSAAYHTLFIHDIHPIGRLAHKIDEAKNKKIILALYAERDYKIMLVRREIRDNCKYFFASAIYYTDEFNTSIVDGIDERYSYVITNGKDTLCYDLKRKGDSLHPVDSVYKTLYLTINDTIKRRLDLVESFEANREKPSVPFYEKLTLGLLFNDLIGSN